MLCRGGGTGRRTGLKILRALKARTGSIPVPGTNKRTKNFSFFFLFVTISSLLYNYLSNVINFLLVKELRLCN